jgi:hypothetical protein
VAEPFDLGFVAEISVKWRDPRFEIVAPQGNLDSTSFPGCAALMNPGIAIESSHPESSRPPRLRFCIAHILVRESRWRFTLNHLSRGNAEHWAISVIRVRV